MTPSRPRRQAEPSGPSGDRTALFRRPPWTERRYVADALRTETIGGALLLLAAVLALLLANSGAKEWYFALRDTTVGPEALHLDLTLGEWASDALLAVFFFVAGLELKREFLVGELRTPAKAVVPVLAAVGGVAVPAVVFLATVLALGADGDALRGWAVPTATDIAFALAVLAVIGSHLPSALRSFLLTLAVVDDLIAIAIIGVFYTDELHPLPMVLALGSLAVFAALVQRRVTHWWLLLPLAAVTWSLVHASGVHATVAGILLGLVVPVRPRRRAPSAMGTMDPRADVAHRFEHLVRPVSAGVAVPVFAFFAAGVTVVGGGFAAALADPVAVGVLAGLVVGKFAGVLGSTWGVARFTRARLDSDLRWADVAGLAMLTGVGFTVSLLVGELAFGAGTERDEHVKLAVLLGSVVSAGLAGVVLRMRNTAHRRIAEQDEADGDVDVDAARRPHEGDVPGHGAAPTR